MRLQTLTLALIAFIAISCKDRSEKKETPETEKKTVDDFVPPTVIPLEHPAIIAQEFVYPLEGRPTPQCHASTIEVSDGIPVASWFGGTHERNEDVGIWVSRKLNGKWTTPVEVANGVQPDGTRHPTWNPVLFKPKDGPLYLFYKVGPNPKTWWGLYMTSDDDGATWSEPVKLPDGILGPIKNQPIQLADGTILSPSSVETESGEWTIHIETSTDNGKTWTSSGPLNDPSEFKAIQPVVLQYGNGRLQLLSRTGNDVVSQNWSEDAGKTWGKMTATDLPNPNSGIDGTTLADGRQLLVYNPTTKHTGNRVPLSLAISSDGKTWDRIMDLEARNETTGEKEEYSYPTIFQAEDGTVHIIYTWNRRTIKYIALDPSKLP